MHIHPDLRALRGDDTAQRLAQAAAHDALIAWQARPAAAAVLGEMAGFGQEARLAGLPALSALFSPGGAAKALVDTFVTASAALLRAQPLAHLGQRHFHDGVQSTLLLARSGNATLSLVAIEGAAFSVRQPPQTASFWPGEAWEHVLAGRATVEAVDCLEVEEGRASLNREALQLEPGHILGRDAARRAMVLRSIAGTFVSLRLQRRLTMAGPTREFDLASGRLVHQAAGNPRDSRIELMMAMLGRMGRKDAAPVMAELARAPGSDSLRWQALRECLALDSRAGFSALCAVARDAADPLAAAAGALRSQLIESYPQLLEAEPCRM